MFHTYIRVYRKKGGYYLWKRICKGLPESPFTMMFLQIHADWGRCRLCIAEKLESSKKFTD